MCGRRSEKSKIVRSGTDALTKMMLPQAIDHHARSARVVIAGDPLGQCETATSGICSLVEFGLSHFSTENQWKSWLHFRAFGMCTAAHVNESRWRLLAVFRNNQCLLRALFEQFLEFRQSCNILTKCLTLLGSELRILFGEHFMTDRSTFGN